MSTTNIARLATTGSNVFTGTLSGSSAVFSSGVTANGTLVAGLANGNIRLKGSTDGFVGVGDTNGTLYLTDWTTGAKGLTIVLSSGAATFSSTVTGTSFFNSSDIRLKELTPYEYDVSTIEPISYFWKDDRDNKKHLGYNAQEIQKVMPEAVNEDVNGFLTVNYIEVLVAKIEMLEKEIKSLKNK
jgi:hypothetical protein